MLEFQSRFAAMDPLDLDPNDHRTHLEVGFRKFVESHPPSKPHSNDLRFVKRVEIPEVNISSYAYKYKKFILYEKGLVIHFNGLWPSPCSIDIWLNKNWRPLIQGEVQQSLCGQGFFVFLFEKKEDRNLIFRNGPYFMGPRGMYLNKWDLSFDPEKYIPFLVLVWVKLPHLPLTAGMMNI